MAQFPISLTEAGVTFAVLNLCNTHNLRNVECFNSVYMYSQVSWKVHAACGVNIIVEGEGLFKVTGSHIDWKSLDQSILETVLDRDVVTTGH